MSEIYRLVFGTLKNVWLGVSVETEKYLHRINILLDIPAAIRFVSLEPLLGPINLHHVPLESPFYYDALSKKGGIAYHKNIGLDWVILGPETGSARRPCKPEWIESIIEQCDEAGVPVFVKALPMGKRISHDPAEWPEHLRRQEYPK
jgi:protein gp37